MGTDARAERTGVLEPRTLVDVLDVAADQQTGSLHFHLEHGIQTLTAVELRHRARRGASALIADGVRPGDAVGILGPNRPEWAVAAFSVWMVGATVVPLPHSALQQPRSAARRTRDLARATGAGTVLVSPELGDAVPVRGARSWILHGPDDTVHTRTDPESPAVIQLTSGSTARPKGVMLSHQSVLAAVRLSSRAQRITGDRDRLLSWLPLFHDYGLFGFLVRPFVTGLESHIIPVERFVGAPVTWFREITRVRATVTAGPPSAWAMTLGRALTQDPGDLDLSSLRLAIMAAEMIDPSTVDDLNAAAPRLGLDPTALTAAYGLAEATLGVSVTRPGGGLQVDTIDLAEYADNRRIVDGADGPVKRVVSCGHPYPGIQTAIVSTHGQVLPEREVGEIWLRGPTLTSGYVAGRTSPFTSDGWLRTGDLGYMSQGQLFVTGRQKDVLIVNGRNYAPEDLEWAATSVRGVRRGRCAAVPAWPDRDGEAVVLVEPGRRADVESLPSRIRTAVARSTGVAPNVAVVPRGTILKTTSGKLRRGAMAEAYHSGSLPALAGSTQEDSEATARTRQAGE